VLLLLTLPLQSVVDASRLPVLSTGLIKSAAADEFETAVALTSAVPMKSSISLSSASCSRLVLRPPIRGLGEQACLQRGVSTSRLRALDVFFQRMTGRLTAAEGAAIRLSGHVTAAEPAATALTTCVSAAENLDGTVLWNSWRAGG